MTRRLLAFIVVFIITMVVICVMAYLLLLPTATERWTTKTQTARTLQGEINTTKQHHSDKTATAQAEIEIANINALSLQATQTVAAQQEAVIATSTHQAAATKTKVAEPTATRPISDCTAEVIVAAPLAAMPGGGWNYDVKVTKAATVSVIYSLDDKGWYPINFNGQYGWLQAENLKFDQACPTQDTLTHILSLVNPLTFVNDFNQTVVVEDTFFRNLYDWKTVKQPQSTLGRKPDENFNADYQLVMDVYPGEQQISTNALAKIANPSVTVSLSRKNVDDNSYVGLRFDSSSNEGANFEVHILGGNCTIQVNENNVKIPDQIVEGTDKACSGGAEDLLEFKLFESSLDVRINGKGPYTIRLSKDYGIGNLSLIAKGAKVRLSFLVVTTPR